MHVARRFELADRRRLSACAAQHLENRPALALLRRCRATVVVCTPTYALHLAEIALQEGVNLRDSEVRVTIHAGEPGASVPSVRKRIEDLWGARAFDHAGASEIGAFAYACDVRDGLHVNEAEFIAAMVSRLFTSLLAGISALDGVTYAGVALMTMGCAVVAALAASWRLRRTSPADALRAT